MTTSAQRRRRSTVIAVAVTVVVLIVAGGITALGAATLANSRAGRNATADELPIVRLPATPTGLIGVLDDAGRLTAMAVAVVDPDGVGGSLVPIAPTADASLGLGDERLPVAETLALEGPEAFRSAVEALTALSFDVIELVDAPRLAALLAPVGPVVAEVPSEVLDDDREEPVAAAGSTRLETADVVEMLTAWSSARADHFNDPGRDAVWAAIAAGVGAGVTTAPSGELTAPRTSDELLQRLFAGSVGSRPILTTVPDDEANPRGVDVVVPDRADLLLVFGGIAPGRLGSPNPSHSFRIESALTDAQTATVGSTSTEVLLDVIARLLYVQANVVSVAAPGGEAPEITQVIVADEAIRATVEELYPLLFGEIEVVPAEQRIEGIDVVLVLGRSYVDFLAAGSVVDDVAEEVDALLEDQGLLDGTIVGEPSNGADAGTGEEEDNG
jgi:hypothetical protein